MYGGEEGEDIWTGGPYLALDRDHQNECSRIHTDGGGGGLG